MCSSAGPGSELQHSLTAEHQRRQAGTKLKAADAAVMHAAAATACAASALTAEDQTLVFLQIASFIGCTASAGQWQAAAGWPLGRLLSLLRRLRQS